MKDSCSVRYTGDIFQFPATHKPGFHQKQLIVVEDPKSGASDIGSLFGTNVEPELGQIDRLGNLNSGRFKAAEYNNTTQKSILFVPNVCGIQ